MLPVVLGLTTMTGVFCRLDICRVKTVVVTVEGDLHVNNPEAAKPVEAGTVPLEESMNQVITLAGCSFKKVKPATHVKCRHILCEKQSKVRPAPVSRISSGSYSDLYSWQQRMLDVTSSDQDETPSHKMAMGKFWWSFPAIA
jgi:hypothetical protein